MTGLNTAANNTNVKANTSTNFSSSVVSGQSVSQFSNMKSSLKDSTLTNNGKATNR